MSPPVSRPTPEGRVVVAIKWRPSLRALVAALALGLLALPLAGIFLFRVYENQLVRQTEGELIAQSALLVAMFKAEADRLPDDEGFGAPAAAAAPEPWEPSLDLAVETVRPRRPAALAPTRAADPRLVEIGGRLAALVAQAQATTLVGARLLDGRGVVIGGRDELGLSLAHVDEVRDAMAGRLAMVVRERVSDEPFPPVYSLSRGAKLRLFVAAPVEARGRLAGVVYLSRTPNNVFRHFYAERRNLAWALAAMLAGAGLLAFMFHRAIARPVRALAARADAIAKGERAALAPLPHYGAAETARLAQSVFDMAAALRRRSDDLAIFAQHVTHELRSPLTSIRGAAELLRDDLDAPAGRGMSRHERARFLDVIADDAGRLDALATRLRELAKAEAAPQAGETTLREAATGLGAALAPDLVGEVDRRVAVTRDALAAALKNLVDNAAAMGARRVVIEARVGAGSRGPGERLEAHVRDDGPGVSPGNREKLFEPFFTTRRDAGGTGMGLPIARALLRAQGGDLVLVEPAPPAEPAGAGVLGKDVSKSEISRTEISRTEIPRAEISKTEISGRDRLGGATFRIEAPLAE